MVTALPLLGVFTVVAGVFFQFVAQPVLFRRFGIGRSTQSRASTNCQKLTEFEACEDGWYHQDSGLLYLACSTQKGRLAWLPNQDYLDLDNRPEDDYLAIYNTKGSGTVASRTTIVKPEEFDGTNGKGSYNLHGIAVHMMDDETIRIFLINHRPQLDAPTVGANSTIELFETSLGSGSMRHIKTFADPVIFTPNNLAPTGPDSFIFSNDHSVKAGSMKLLDIFTARSNVAMCDRDGCKKVLDPFFYPNGIAGGTQYPNTNPKMIYIASSTANLITVAEVQADKSLVVIDKISVDYPHDNINQDVDGDIWAAGFPDLLALTKSFKDPAKTFAPTVVNKISKNTGKDAFYGNKYKVENIIEDDGTNLSGFTFAAYDTERKLVFAGGVMTPYVAICPV